MAHVPPETMIVRDSRLPPERPDSARILVTEGPSSVTYQTVSAADKSSLTPVFNIELPSQLTGLQRQLYWQASGTFTVTGTNMGDLLTGERVAFRQFPLQSMCSNVEVQMNDTTLSIGSLNQIIQGLLRKGNPVKAAGHAQSSTPAMFDTVAEYGRVLGRQDSPFAAVGDRLPSSASACARTVGITGITLVDATTLTVDFTVEEPLIIPPFTYTDDGRNKALYGLNQVQVSCNISTPQRGLSIATAGSTATLTGTTVKFATQALLCTFVTPNDRSIALAVKESKMFRYDCPRVQLYATNFPASIPGFKNPVDQTLNSNSFQLPVVPEAIMVWVQPTETFRTASNASNADFFLPITSMQCQAGTRSGLLSGATEADLWAMSNRNGADIPYWMYNALPQITSLNAATPDAQVWGSGGPVILNVARDLSLPEGVVPGMSINWTFAATSITCRNPYSGELADGVRVMVVPIMPGVLTNQGGSSSVCIGGVPGIDSAHLPAAPKMLSMEFNELTSDGGFGGAIQGGSRIGDWFKHLGAQIRHSAYKTGDAIKHAAYKAGDAIKHEAWKAGDVAKDAAYKVGHIAEGVADHAIQSAAHGLASSVTGHGYGGRRVPRSMLYS